MSFKCSTNPRNKQVRGRNLIIHSRPETGRFRFRPDAKARTAAERDGVEIRTYSVIYKAIEEIDKAIRRMEEIKKFLTTSENQLRLANNKLDDVSVKKLTRKNPTMKAKFEALKGD